MQTFSSTAGVQPGEQEQQGKGEALCPVRKHFEEGALDKVGIISHHLLGALRTSLNLSARLRTSLHLSLSFTWDLTLPSGCTKDITRCTSLPNLASQRMTLLPLTLWRTWLPSGFIVFIYTLHVYGSCFHGFSHFVCTLHNQLSALASAILYKYLTFT